MRICTTALNYSSIDRAICDEVSASMVRDALEENPAFKIIAYVPKTGALYAGKSILSLASEIKQELDSSNIRKGYVEYMRASVFAARVAFSDLQRNV
ncbi:MAG: hypothetical protein QXM31_03435 [Candidatus Woesearchaeota archaeon]